MNQRFRQVWPWGSPVLIPQRQRRPSEKESHSWKVPYSPLFSHHLHFLSSLCFRFCFVLSSSCFLIFSHWHEALSSKVGIWFKRMAGIDHIVLFCNMWHCPLSWISCLSSQRAWYTGSFTVCQALCQVLYLNHPI